MFSVRNRSQYGYNVGENSKSSFRKIVTVSFPCFRVVESVRSLVVLNGYRLFESDTTRRSIRFGNPGEHKGTNQYQRNSLNKYPVTEYSHVMKYKKIFYSFR